MSEPNFSVLIVEDEIINREILVEFIGDCGYQAIAVEDAERAWALLQSRPADFSAVILDRRLPAMDGMQLLELVRSSPALRHLPVIMQTGMDSHSDIMEGLKAGAYYYLTKPIDPDTLLPIVTTAVEDYEHHRALLTESRKATQTLQYMTRAEFAFRTPEEARSVASCLAGACPDAMQLVLGLSELMLNAIEHGNLAITYEEKTELISKAGLQAEIERRLRSAEFGKRYATVTYERVGNEVRFLITDQGKGFDWMPFLELSPERAFDTHGRGIAMAGKLSFDRLQFIGKGNQVLACLTLPGEVDSLPGADRPRLVKAG